jgi:hypothetical protein
MPLPNGAYYTYIRNIKYVYLFIAQTIKTTNSGGERSGGEGYQLWITLSKWP